MTNSSNDIPPSRTREFGGAAILLVMCLLVMVSIMGAGVLRVFSNESNQTASEGVGFRLEQLTRIGLESNFSLLRSMGTTTALQGDAQQVNSSAQTVNRAITNCNYFPRTDDVKLVTAVGSSFQNTALLSSGATATCLTARPQHSSLTPAQLARHSTYTNNDIFSTDNQLDVIASGVTNDQNFRSVFPWVRHPGTASALNDRYGSTEEVAKHLNQCGLSSQFKSVSSQTSTPLQRFRYQQDLDGLGETWINMGNSTMNLHDDGLTLEAWVWMGNQTNSQRTWQRIFDIGRGQMDGNIVFAYEGTSGLLQLHIKSKGSCANTGRDPTNETPISGGCSGEGFALAASDRIQVPFNNVAGNSLSEASGNDLWYYVGVTVDNATADSPKVQIYTQCKRSDNSNPNNSVCEQGDLRRGEGQTGLRRRVDVPIQWQSANDYAHFRRTWVGKSHWQDDDFRGKMRDLRVWNRTLDETELNQPIAATVTENNTESSIISNVTLRESLRLSPLYRFGNDRLILFTVKETDAVFTNTWRLVSCAWNTRVPKRSTQSLRFRVLGDARPEVTEYLPY